MAWCSVKKSTGINLPSPWNCNIVICHKRSSNIFYTPLLAINCSEVGLIWCYYNYATLSVTSNTFVYTRWPASMKRPAKYITLAHGYVYI
jgi:hypothetical protein